MTRQVCFVVGARPNFMKAAPVYSGLAELDQDIELLLVHTGQHYDEGMSRVFIDELQMPQPDVFLGVGSGTHAEQTAKVLVGVERVLLERTPSLVVVPGDVNSTLAAALAASKLRIPIAHIESGLRSFDETMPEEANRRLTDHLSSVLLAHSDSAVENLLREGVAPDRIHLVGNTMIDSVLRHLPLASAREPWREFGVEPARFALVTLHRPALVDDPTLLRRAVDALSELARTLPVIFPVHPRTEARLSATGLNPSRSSRGQVLPPAGLSRFPGTRGEGRIRPHRLWGDSRGDVGARCPLLHPARQHGAADHRRAWDEHRIGCRSRTDPGDSRDVGG